MGSTISPDEHANRDSQGRLSCSFVLDLGVLRPLATSADGDVVGGKDSDQRNSTNYLNPLKCPRNPTMKIPSPIFNYLLPFESIQPIPGQYYSPLDKEPR
jgi:hypothetical protein